jgi:hypothetical protein
MAAVAVIGPASWWAVRGGTRDEQARYVCFWCVGAARRDPVCERADACADTVDESVGVPLVIDGSDRHRLSDAKRGWEVVHVDRDQRGWCGVEHGVGSEDMDCRVLG